jgi:hypothetical protein
MLQQEKSGNPGLRATKIKMKGPKGINTILDVYCPQCDQFDRARKDGMIMQNVFFSVSPLLLRLLNDVKTLFTVYF